MKKIITSTYEFCDVENVAIHPTLTTFTMSKFDTNDALTLVKSGILESAHINPYTGKWVMWTYTEKIIAIK